MIHWILARLVFIFQCELIVQWQALHAYLGQQNIDGNHKYSLREL